MTTRIASIVILLVLSCSAFAQSAEKTFSKSFNTDGKSTISLDLPGSVDVKEWDSPNIRVSINVSLASGSESMLGELARVGRYNLISKSAGDVLTIQSPNMQKQIRIKGEELREKLSYEVFVPKNLIIETPNAAVYAENRK